MFWNSYYSKQLRTAACEMTFQRLEAVNYFHNKAPSLMLIRVLYKPLPFSAGIYLLKVNNRNFRIGEICSEFTKKTPERCLVNFEQVIAGWVHSPVGIYLFKVNNRNTRTRCEICSELTIKTREPHHWCLYC